MDDFERAWQGKFARCLDEAVGEHLRIEIMQGGEALSDQSAREDVIAWSAQAMDRLDAHVDASTRRQIMAGCACQYPKPALSDARARYQATHDPDAVLQVLQAQFEAFLRDTLKLDDETIQTIVQRGWGLAGVRQGSTIIATKIPKSGHLAAYMNEADPAVRRQLYCHCPRVRDVLKAGGTLSTTYCYCGAGFYKGLWEEILQAPVQIEVLETVLDGDDVCKFAIHIE